MDSLDPKSDSVRSLETVNAGIAAVSDVLLGGANVTPVELLKLLRSLRHLKAEAETLEQILQSLAQKRPS